MKFQLLLSLALAQTYLFTLKDGQSMTDLLQRIQTSGGTVSNSYESLGIVEAVFKGHKEGLESLELSFGQIADVEVDGVVNTL